MKEQPSSFLFCMLGLGRLIPEKNSMPLKLLQPLFFLTASAGLEVRQTNIRFLEDFDLGRIEIHSHPHRSKIDFRSAGH